MAGIFFMHKTANLAMATYFNTDIDCAGDPKQCTEYNSAQLPNSCCTISGQSWLCNWVSDYQCRTNNTSPVTRTCWEEPQYTNVNHLQCDNTLGCSGGVCNVSTPPTCTSDGSCDAYAPACGTTTYGVDNCGVTCSKTGGACGCSPDGSCDAYAPACGTTTTGHDNCGGTCTKIGSACGTPTPGSGGCTWGACGANGCSSSQDYVSGTGCPSWYTGPGCYDDTKCTTGTGGSGDRVVCNFVNYPADSTGNYTLRSSNVYSSSDVINMSVTQNAADNCFYDWINSTSVRKVIDPNCINNGAYPAVPYACDAGAYGTYAPYAPYNDINGIAGRTRYCFMASTLNTNPVYQPSAYNPPAIWAIPSAPLAPGNYCVTFYYGGHDSSSCGGGDSTGTAQCAFTVATPAPSPTPSTPSGSITCTPPTVNVIPPATTGTATVAGSYSNLPSGNNAQLCVTNTAAPGVGNMETDGGPSGLINSTGYGNAHWISPNTVYTFNLYNHPSSSTNCTGTILSTCTVQGLGPTCQVSWSIPPLIQQNSSTPISVSQSFSNIGWNYVTVYLDGVLQNLTVDGPNSYQSIINSGSASNHTLTFKVNDYAAYGAPAGVSPTTTCTPAATFTTASIIPPWLTPPVLSGFIDCTGTYLSWTNPAGDTSWNIIKDGAAITSTTSTSWSTRANETHSWSVYVPATNTASNSITLTAVSCPTPTPAPAWIQTTGGDVHSNGTIRVGW